jgi:hypothetical protein
MGSKQPSVLLQRTFQLNRGAGKIALFETAHCVFIKGLGVVTRCRRGGNKSSEQNGRTISVRD